jgi:hypothetical protein
LQFLLQGQGENTEKTLFLYLSGKQKQFLAGCTAVKQDFARNPLTICGQRHKINKSSEYMGL